MNITLSCIPETEKMVSEEAENAIECKPVVEDLDSEPTEQDLKKALGSLPPEKALARMVFEQKS